MSSIIRAVPGNETEVGMGVLVSTPTHYVVAWGEYASEGEADGEIRVIAAINSEGVDITATVALKVAEAINHAIENGDI